MSRLPERPNLEFHKKAAKARTKVGEFKTHAAALFAIAREHGFTSWPAMKAFINARRLERDDRRAHVVRAACSDKVRHALALLEVEPAIARDDIYAACTFGEVDAVERWLADPAARVNDRGGPNNWPPLLYACFSRVLRVDAARRPRIADVVDRLLAAGADPNAHYLDDGEVEAALYGAAGIANDPRITAALLAAGASPNDSETLYHACEVEDVTCLRLVLEAKPDPKWLSYCLRRMLDFQNEAGVRLFLEHGADPRVPLRPGLRPQLQQALVVSGRASTVGALLDRGADPNEVWNGMNAYKVAVRFGRDEAAALLAARGADTSTVDDHDRAIGACVAGRTPPPVRGPVDAHDVLEHVARAGRVDAVRALLALDPSIDTVLARTRALHAAVWTGRGAVVRLLLDRGVDLAYRNEFGGDAFGATTHGSLHCQDPDGGPGAKLTEEAHRGDYAEIVEMLLAAGMPVPAHTEGSEAIRGVLRRYGAVDPE
jgi:ankyrin repeat protein